MATARAVVAGIAATGLLATAGAARADQVAQPLPVLESWTDTARLASSNDWSAVPGFLGRRGNQLVTVEGVDPQTVLGGGDSTQISLHPNRTDPDETEVPGVAEFELEDPVVGLHATNLADAPHLVVALDTVGASYVRVVYRVVDLDGSDDDSASPLALQGRIGGAGNYTNVAAGFVADATGGNAADLTTQVDVILPIGGHPLVELRWITSNQADQDEWIGIDDIAITASAAPTAAGAMVPDPVIAGAEARIVVDVTAGSNPASTELVVRCDFALLGIPDWVVLFDDGAHGDGADGDLRFARAGTIGGAAGVHAIPCRVRDHQDRRTDFTVTVEVLAVCGDGRIEGGEACDDGGDEGGDGCDDDCAIEPGWSCSGAPSLCADLDECADGTAGCAPDATCDNLPGGFTCVCDDGYAGDGLRCETVCGDGLIVGGETCDDGNPAGGDGCDEFCHRETGWVCRDEPSSCVADRDADGIEDELDNCPEHGNAGQADADDDGVGDACDDDEPPSGGGGGGCQSGGGGAAWPLLITLVGLLALQWRSSRTRRAARRRSS